MPTPCPRGRDRYARVHRTRGNENVTLANTPRTIAAMAFGRSVHVMDNGIRGELWALM